MQLVAGTVSSAGNNSIPGWCLCVAACGILLVATGCRRAAQARQQDRAQKPSVEQKQSGLYYASIRLNGKAAGYRLTSTTCDGAVCETHTRETLYVNRAGTVVPATSWESFRETVDGRPLSFATSRQSSGTETRCEGTVRDDQVTVRVSQDGREHTSSCRWGTMPLFPAAYARLRIAKGFTPGTQYEVPLLCPGLDIRRPTHMKLEVLGWEDLPVMGQSRSAVKFRCTFSGFENCPQYDWLGDDGQWLMSSMSVNGVEITAVRCDRRKALTVDGLSLPEIFSQTTIPAPEVFSQACRWRRLVLELLLGGSVKPPESASQKAWSDGHRLVIELVSSDEPRCGRVTLDEASPYREASAHLDWKDPEVARLLDACGVSDAAPWKAATRLTNYVFNIIEKKDLSRGFATASEVARELRGDCTEHAVLLAALLRARGLPSRVVSGLCYGPGSDGRNNLLYWHMWTQVNIDNQWYDLDASSNQVCPSFDRLALAAASLGDVNDEFVLAAPMLSIERGPGLRVLRAE